MSFLRPSPIILAFVGVAGIISLRSGQLHSAAPAVADATVVAGYKTWTKVNPKPHEVESSLAGLCRSSTPEEHAREASNPHLDQSPNAPFARTRFVTVYVNDTAKDAMLNQKSPVFPEGSVIVKEKLAHSDSQMPELLTVMRKREKGFNAPAGDWEYIVVSGDGAKITAQGKLKNCESCHADYKSTDFVARTYMADKWARLHE